MALYELEHYLFKLKNDPAMQAELQHDAAAHLARQQLDEPARAALLNKDLAALWHLGAHPLLLAPLSRYFGMAPTEYRAVLKPFRHQRQFRS